MSSATLSQLKTALLVPNNTENIRYALSAYLKEDVPSRSEFLAPEPVKESCGAGVDAVLCSSVITDCLDGSNVGKCVSTLESITPQLRDGFKNMNSALALKVCGVLGINNVDSINENAYDKWIIQISAKDAVAGQKIAKNSALAYIIKSFIVAARNPLVDPKSVEFAQKRIELTATIKARSPRMLVQVQSGGGVRRNTYNRYAQYSDSLRTIASMTGGAKPLLNTTYDELANLYNNFVTSLRLQNKQIDADDNNRIRQLLSELKYTEGKLKQVVHYINRYDSVRSNPEFKDLIETNNVTVDLLASLEDKYNKYQAKQQRKIGSFLSITDALNKAVNDISEMKDDLKEIKNCVGPLCPPGAGSAASATFALPASGPAPGAVVVPNPSAFAAAPRPTAQNRQGVQAAVAAAQRYMPGIRAAKNPYTADEQLASQQNLNILRGEVDRTEKALTTAVAARRSEADMQPIRAAYVDATNALTQAQKEDRNALAQEYQAKYFNW